MSAGPLSTPIPAFRRVPFRAGAPMRIPRLLIGATLATAVAACSDSDTMPTQSSPTTEAVTARSNSAVDGAERGFTLGWLAGQTVNFSYHKPFFCRTPVED